MNRFDQQWRKLTALARQSNDARLTEIPFGFSTRVAAQASGMTFGPSSVPIERFALRGLLVAAAFGMAAIAVNYGTLITSTQTDALVAADVVGELMDPS